MAAPCRGANLGQAWGEEDILATVAHPSVTLRKGIRNEGETVE